MQFIYMSIQIEIIVNTNPDNSRYKTIQYSNQIHTTVDTNPYTSRYNSIQQSIQYNSPNAKLHIVDTLVHTTYSPYTSPNAKLHTVQSSCYSRGQTAVPAAAPTTVEAASSAARKSSTLLWRSPETTCLD